MSSALRRVIAELVNQTTNGVLDWQRPPGSIGWTAQVGNCIFELRPDLYSLKIVLDDSGDRSSSSYFTPVARSMGTWRPNAMDATTHGATSTSIGAKAIGS